MLSALRVSRAIPSLVFKSGTVGVTQKCFGSGYVKETPLCGIHKQLGAKMGDFCGWNMPFEYPSLSPSESHFHTRERASLFDVSHMLRLRITGKYCEEYLEKLFVADLQKLKVNEAAYTLLMNENGGIIDDAILTKGDDYYYLVLNAACAHKDYEYLQKYQEEFRELGKHVQIEQREGGLIALQGPAAAAALQSIALNPCTIGDMKFMDSVEFTEIAGIPCRVTRCGYTGEDGFEIESIDNIDKVAKALLDLEDVEPAGLIARDTLRLEAGLALYGNDLNEKHSPIESSLNWTITKRRREAADFLGAETVLRHLKEGVEEKRVGLVAPPGRLLRHGMEVREGDKVIGTVCSGGFSPCLKHPIGMAYVKKDFSKIGRELNVKAGKSSIPVTVSKMPFVPTNYKSSK